MVDQIHEPLLAALPLPYLILQDRISARKRRLLNLLDCIGDLALVLALIHGVSVREGGLRARRPVSGELLLIPNLAFILNS